MATCPTCGGYLSDRHQCPGPPWRAIFRELFIILLGVSVGGMLPFLVTPQPVTVLTITTGLLGGALAFGLLEAVKR